MDSPNELSDMRKLMPFEMPSVAYRSRTHPESPRLHMDAGDNIGSLLPGVFEEVGVKSAGIIRFLRDLWRATFGAVRIQTKRRDALTSGGGRLELIWTAPPRTSLAMMRKQGNRNEAIDACVISRVLFRLPGNPDLFQSEQEDHEVASRSRILPVETLPSSR